MSFTSETVYGEENVLVSGNVKMIQNSIPLWLLLFSSAILCTTFAIGIPLNAATVAIFWRRKKLRHLVNFVLLVDCLSHIVLCLVCLPIQITSVWTDSFTDLSLPDLRSFLYPLQQVVGDFVNLQGILLAVSIAILRYRRLCWKKKDKFCAQNAFKWTFTSVIISMAIAFIRLWSIYLSWPKRLEMFIFVTKMALITSSVFVVVFCYFGISKRVWQNAARQDRLQQKKRHEVHLRATIHSCVQILLFLTTFAPHVYEETVGALGLFDGLARGKHSRQLPDSLLSKVLNYAFLALGTPLAYIASCHGFREQFQNLLNNILPFTSSISSESRPSISMPQRIIPHPPLTHSISLNFGKSPEYAVLNKAKNPQQIFTSCQLDHNVNNSRPQRPSLMSEDANEAVGSHEKLVAKDSTQILKELSERGKRRRVERGFEESPFHYNTPERSNSNQQSKTETASGGNLGRFSFPLLLSFLMDEKEKEQLGERV